MEKMLKSGCAIQIYFLHTVNVKNVTNICQFYKTLLFLILCHGYQLFTRYSWVTSSVEQFIPLSSSGIFRQVTDPGSDLPVIHTSCLSRWPQMPSCRQSASYFTSKENKL